MVSVDLIVFIVLLLIIIIIGPTIWMNINRINQTHVVNDYVSYTFLGITLFLILVLFILCLYNGFTT